MKSDISHKEVEKTSNDELDLLELAGLIWSKRMLLIKITSACVLLGLFIALGSKAEYEASCKVLIEDQESSKKNLGGLSSLAGLAGINLGMSSSTALTPDLYPDIVTSAPFQTAILNTPIKFSNIETEISCVSYFNEYDKPSPLGWLKRYTVGLPGLIRSKIGSGENIQKMAAMDDGLVRISAEDWKFMEKFEKRVNVSVDAKSGLVSFSVELPDPLAAAHLTRLVVDKLTEEIVDYKLGKLRSNHEFIVQRYAEVESNYQAKQNQLAQFRDRNKNLATSMVQAEYQRLENEMDIAFEVYKSLAAQLEQSKIRVKEETPAFTVLEPVQVPIFKSKPRRMMIVGASLLAGLLIGVSYVLIAKGLKERRAYE